MVPAGKPPAALEDRAHDFIRRMAPEASDVDDTWGLGAEWGYTGYVAEKDRSFGRWGDLAGGNPPVLQFWYRQSPRPLVSMQPSGKVYWMKPGLDVSGMAGATYDMEGRLLRFYSIPPQLESEPAAPAAAPDWSTLFSEARLDPASFRAVTPRWTPPFYVDTRAAWEGSWPGRPDIGVRIEAAAHRGRPAWFEIVWPWSRPERMESQSWPTAKLMYRALFLTVVVVLVGAAAFMARRNLVLGRGDRRGAFRVSLLLCGVGIVSWALGAHNVADWNAQIGLVTRGAGGVVLEAAFVWLVYLAVEPYARRLRPWTLVSWTRILGGGFSDPVVGRDVLVGLAWAVLVFFLSPLRYVLPPVFGAAPPEPSYGSLDALLGPGPLLGATLGTASESTLYALGILLLYVLLRSVLRRDGLASLALVVLLLLPSVLGAGEAAWFTLPVSIDLDAHLDRAAASLRAAGGERRALRLRAAVLVPDHERAVLLEGRPHAADPAAARPAGRDGLPQRRRRNRTAPLPGARAQLAPLKRGRSAPRLVSSRPCPRPAFVRPSPTARRARRPTTRTSRWASSSRARGARTSTRSTPSPVPPTTSPTSRSTRA